MNILLALTEVLGGLALFLFGLRELSQGLQGLAGNSLRSRLRSATRSHPVGYTLGSVLGLLLHSSGATVMLVGFLNAGLITLSQAIPVMLGANVGTTFSMQAVSLNLTALSYPAIAMGFGLHFTRSRRLQGSGHALFGFGLLFLGMEIMGAGVEPFREDLAPFLSGLNTGGLGGILAGIALSMAITAVLQSSGATIGMCFAMLQAGVFSSVEQVMPLILGAHIGTCVTAGLASIGGRAPARRMALAHLLFNLFNVTLAVLLRTPLLSLVESLGGDFVRQAANLHSLVMLIASIPILLLATPYSRLITRIIPSPASEETEDSALTPERMSTTASALTAAREEMARMVRLGQESLSLNQSLLHHMDRRKRERIRHLERVFDAVKETLIRDLRKLERDVHTRREDLKDLERWIQAANQMERVGDHLNTLRRISEERQQEPGTLLFGNVLSTKLQDLFTECAQAQDRILHEVYSPEASNLEDLKKRQAAFLENTAEARKQFETRMNEKRLQPRVFYYYNAYLETLERLMRHLILLADAA